MMNDDMELAREYAANHSEAAFETLVARHIGLVHSAALRQVRDPHLAEEITQTVFTILARKAGSLSPKIILPGWLYRTTRYVSAAGLKIQRRRERREQEAHMQAMIDEAQADSAWEQLAPLLDDAMAQLRDQDRDAIVLRYFQNKSLRDVGMAMGVDEYAAQKRVMRALEKLRAIFVKRGAVSTAAIIAGALSAYSVQATPATLTKSVAAIAITKGAATSGSTLTLIKGALKIMAWTKAKMAVVAGAGFLLILGTTMVTINEIHTSKNDAWRVPKFKNLPVDAPTLMAKTPPQVRIVKSKYSHWTEGTPFTQGSPMIMSDGKFIVHTNESTSVGIGVKAADIIKVAYDVNDLRLILPTRMPGGLYDFIANLPQGAMPVLQEQIKLKFGLVGTWEKIDTDVLVLKLARPELQAFKPANDFGDSVGSLRGSIENVVGDGLPVIDETGLTNRYHFSFDWPQVNTSTAAGKQSIKNALYSQLGLELVPTNIPIEKLVVREVK